MVVSGMTMREIGGALGVSKQAVSEYLKKHNKEPLPKVKRKPWHGFSLKDSGKALKARYRLDPSYRAMCLMRRRMHKLLKEGCKSARTKELIGCTAEELRRHIEKQWKPGMTWQNTGSGPGRWQVDHIMPCSSFDLTDPAQQRRCFHFTNLRPLWAEENMQKRAAIPANHQWSLLL
jgi:hypothetical protein